MLLFSVQIIDDPEKCGDCVGVLQVAWVLVILGFALVAESTQLVDHLVQPLDVCHFATIRRGLVKFAGVDAGLDAGVFGQQVEQV
jgi:hypothetical protein